MAQEINVNDLFHGRLITSQDDQVGVTGLDWVVTQKVGVFTDQALIDALSTELGALMQPLMSNEATYRGMTGTINRAGVKLSQVQTQAGTGLGTAPSGPLPKQVCGLVQKRTLFAGRAYRGRLYLPFPPTNVGGDSDFPDANYRNTAATFVGSALTEITVTNGLNTLSIRPVLIHTNKALAPTPITSTQVSTKWATQRRRGSYGRPNLIPVLSTTVPA